MKKQRISRILVRVLRLVLPLVLLPLLISGIFHLNMTGNLANQYASLNIEAIAAETSEKIESYFKNSRVLLKNIAIIVSNEKNPMKNEEVIKRVLLENSMFKYIFTTDSDGTEIANTNVEMGYREHRNDEYVFKAIADGDSSSKIKFTPDNLPYIVMCNQIKEWGKTSGAICAEIDCRIIWDILDSIKVGKEGYAYLVSEDGVLISHPDKRAVLEGRNLSALKPVSMVIRGEKGTITYGEKEKIASFLPIESRGWGIIVEQPKDESLHLYLLAKKISVYFLIFLLLITLLVAFYFSYSLTSPIRSLANATEIVSSGNLNYKVPVESTDELGSLAKSFNEMTEKLKKIQERLIQSEKLVSLGELSAGVAHELNRPLSGMFGYIQLIERELESDETLNKYIKETRLELKRANKIVRNLLDFSEKARLEFKDIDIRRIVETSINLAKHYFRNYEKTIIKCNMESVLPMTIGDSGQLHQVFMNILMNAAAAIGAEGIIEVSVSHKDGEIQIVFKDDGVGISTRSMERIFEPFYTTKIGGEGAGLGLYISQKIVKAHSGNIEVESSEGKGTIVTVVLPAKEESV